MNDSQRIAQTFYELRKFCRNIALLLKTGDEIFANKSWRSAQPDSTCVYSGSYSFSNPQQWLPKRFFRFYSNPSFPRLLAYLAVVLDLPRSDDDENGTTILTAGILKFADPKYKEKCPSGDKTKICMWHLYGDERNDSGEPIIYNQPFKMVEERFPSKWKKLVEKVDKACTVGLPIHEIGDAAQLEKRVVEPLLNSIRGIGEVTEL